ncbi:SufS family cysteine desulfurase [Halobacterium sp. R2-5]|uniref:SufS family cysteine desulfurase n=1 Tax=Halobacterium sp. R2-5 TaxID=2715751 RepID=UPI0014233D14|nr:SufS family cysteine desulfurase [Halobacterium sp. R2-5]
MSFDAEEVRADFPILDREVGDGQPLVYLDNAATTQTPDRVSSVEKAYYDEYNANVHRGIHTLSHEASVAYEDAHDRLAEFVGADGREEMVFTKNATEAVNLVAYGLADRLGPEDAIVTTEMEHHASLVTWQQLAERTGADLRYVEVDDDGTLDVEQAKDVVDGDVEIVSVAHVSNVLGTVNPVRELADLAHDAGGVVVVDGAQSVPTRPVDVEELGADFLAFSGHKMAGPTGIGCLYGREELLEEMEPFLFGGEMIRHVTFDESTWNELPWKFEAGTPPIAEGIALAEAADYLDELGMDAVREHENELAQYLLRELAERENAETYGPPPGVERTGLVAFNVDGVHGHDLSELLDDRGIAVRAGDHCTQPLHDILDVPGSVRASFYVYSTRQDVDALLDATEDAPARRDDLLASERYHDSVLDHFKRQPNAGGLADPTFSKHSAETSCGDDGEFHVDVAGDGTIAEIGFVSQSCAVSSAVASILADDLEGRPVEALTNLEGRIEELLEGQYPDMRKECVVGPEDVIREGATEHLDAARGASGAATD